MASQTVVNVPPTVTDEQPAVTGKQPSVSEKQPSVSEKPSTNLTPVVTDQPTNQTENEELLNDQKRVELDKLKSLEDNIILYIKKSGQDNKSIFLSMLINYVMCYSDDYTSSLEELSKNNGISFEKHIKMYLIQLLNHYKNPKSSLQNDDVSFSQIKLMLLSFFHKKISIIPDVVEPQIKHINTGAPRVVLHSNKIKEDEQAALNKEKIKAEFDEQTRGGFRDLSKLTDALHDMFE